MAGGYLRRLGARLTLVGFILDELLCAVTGGDRHETVSLRAARARAERRRWGCVLCGMLSRLVERDHCDKVLTDEHTTGVAALRAGILLFLIWGLFWLLQAFLVVGLVLAAWRWGGCDA